MNEFDHILHEEFRLACQSFMEEWRYKKIPYESISAILMAEIKVEACYHYKSYIIMISSLSKLLFVDLEEIFRRVHLNDKNDNSEKKEEKSCPL